MNENPAAAELGRDHFRIPRDWMQYNEWVERSQKENDMMMISPWLSEFEREMGAWYQSSPIT